MSLKIREYMITKIIHEEKIQKAKKYVEKGESFVIVTHVTPDGDAIGSALGLYHFLTAYGKDTVTVVVPNDFPQFYKWMPGHKEIVIHEKYPDDVVISADTTIYHSGKIIGKAHSAHEAREILESLSSDTHSVFTSVAVFYKDQVCTFVDETKVTFKNINDMIDDYLSIDEWKGKAGAYAIQGVAGKFIEEVRGDIDNVIGLPVKHVIEVIETLTKKPL